MNPKNFIRAIRIKAGLTQAQFGKAIELECESDESFQSSISRYEGGATITFDIADKMLGVIGLSLGECLEFPEDHKRNKELHRALDRLLADPDRVRDVRRYVELMDLDLRNNPATTERPG